VNSTAGDPTRSGRPRWLRGLFRILLATVALLALIEIVTRLLTGDWQVVDKPDSRGFDPQEPYIVPADPLSAGLTTRIFDSGAHEVQIPPKDGRQRVVLFGGSNTRLLPEAFLQALLDERGAPQRFEVFNLGRHGYGSGRERVLFEQALVLQPDVVFLYSGHNEFVEEQYRDAVMRSREDWGRSASDTLRKLKAVDTLVSELRSAAQKTRTAADAEVDAYATHFATFTRADLDRVYAAFRENLTAICRLGRQAGTRVILATVVRNMFHTPLVSKSGLQPGSAEEQAFDQLHAQAVARIPPRYSDGLLPRISLAVFDWGLQTGEWWEEFYRPAVGNPVGAPDWPQPAASALDEAARLAALWTQVPVAKGALWTPPALWSKRTRRIIDTMCAVHAGSPTTGEREALESAAADLTRAVALAPGHAAARFELALGLAALGAERSRVAQLLDEAGDLDWAPIGGNCRINDIVRDVARSVEGVELLDADALFRSRAANGVLDYGVLMDANHLQAGAKLLLLDDLAAMVAGRVAAPER
jgi:hypothetical protein